MRIGIDARMLLAEPPTAHAALIRQVLLENRRKLCPHEFLLYTDNALHSAGEFSAPNVTLCFLAPARVPGSGFHWLNFRLSRQLRRDLVDVHFSCFYKVPLLTRTTCVNMVHDTAFFNLPRGLLTGRQRNVAYRVLLFFLLWAHCRSAVRTVTVSEFSKGCLQHWLRLPECRLSVCYNPVDAAFFADVALPPPDALPDVPAQYCLFVGSDIPKKNIAGTLTAFASLPESLRMQFPLVLRTKPVAEDLELANALKLDGSIRFLSRSLPAQSITALIRRARLLVLLSYEEGFGLPVAEAMAAGVPVLASSGGSLNEITGHRGIDLASAGPAEIGSQWRLLLTDDEARQTARRLGLERAEIYRPDRVASQFLTLITSVARR
jgi:glycosyltransferase involved in cell wall biosynthesis